MADAFGGSPPRISIFAGHYGSGKTNICVNYALWLRKTGRKVALVDLDIVNPYYRSFDASKILSEHGIDIIASAFAGTNVDLPAVPAAALRVFDDPSLYAVIDVGGDDRGALALGRFAAKIKEHGAVMYAVVNCYRPITRTPEDAIAIIREVEDASGVGFSAIVNNSNIGTETTPDDILASAPYVNEISRITGLPLGFTAIRRDIDVSKADISGFGEILPLDIVVDTAVKTDWRV